MSNFDDDKKAAAAVLQQRDVVSESGVAYVCRWFVDGVPDEKRARKALHALWEVRAAHNCRRGNWMRTSNTAAAR